MKRKNKLLLSFLVFLVCGISVSSFALCGDINGDGNVDIVDALLLAKYVVNPIITDNISLYTPDIADVNNSGTIDIVDALCIAQAAVGVRTLNCPAPATTPGPTSVPGQVWVSRASGIQCEVTYYNTALEAIQDLNNAGITTYQFEVLNYVVITLCGTPTGTVYRALIDTVNIDKAHAIGWN
jgi:hypothetical protein